MTSLILGLLLAAPPSPPPPPPRMEKLTRILASEDRRDLSTDVKVGLIDADRSVRRRAALAAGRIGDPAAVPALVPLLQDTEAEVRQMTAFALGLIGDPLAVDPLLLALKDPEPVVRARAAEALGQIGDARAGPALAQMVIAPLPPKAPLVTVRGDDPASMTDPWLEPRLGLFALARLKDVRSAQAALLAAGKPRFDWWAATWTAMRLESAGPAARAPGRRRLHAIPLSRAYARARPGRAQGPGRPRRAAARSCATATRPWSSTPCARWPCWARRARCRRSPPSCARPPSPCAWRRSKALSVLPPDRALRERVVAEVGSPEPWVRAAALPALARMEREEFALVLANLDPDPGLVRARGPGRRPRHRRRRGQPGAPARHAQGRRRARPARGAGGAARRRAAPTPWTPCAATSTTRTSRCAWPPPTSSPPSRSPA